MTKGTIWLIAALIIAGLLVGGYIYVDRKITQRVDKLLNQEKRSGSYESLSYNIFAGALTLKQLDFAVRETGPVDSVQLTAQRFRIEGLKVLDLLFNRKLRIGRTALVQPRIWVSLAPKPHPMMPDSGAQGKRLEKIELHNLSLEAGSLTLQTARGDSLHVGHFSAQLDSLTQDGGTFWADSADIELRDLDAWLAGKLERLRIRRVKISRRGGLHLDSLAFATQVARIRPPNYVSFCGSPGPRR